MPLMIDPSAVALLPPLKWAGGKRWLVPSLHHRWQQHADKRLVEPFVGGMAVTLGLQPAMALLNDSNPHLINFYEWLQRGLVIDIEMANDSDLYYRQRQRFNELTHTGQAQTQEAASIFYYLNRTGYNGLCRFNRKGDFNVPFGRYRKITYTRDFRAYSDTFYRWTFSNGSFTHLELSDNDLIYADPPYDVPFTSYSAGGFSWDDQVCLAHWLAAHAGPVIASNQATTRIVELYSSLGFDIEILSAPRMISCTGDRTPAQEMLATKRI